MNSDLEKFLQMAATHRVPPKERTIFSIGGRGYYENAASDMLAFFLRPHEEHGFGTIFLSVFFECMGKKENEIPMLINCTIEREQYTKQGNRIDLQINGGDWCLIIENKIWHTLNNPLKDYETHAGDFGKTQYFAILSPGGDTCQNWVGIKYADYCLALRQRLGKVMFDSPHSKWLLFAREFILHLENELYNPTMNTENADFVEKHESQIAAVKQLDSDYRVFLQKLLKQSLDDKIPGHDFWTKVVDRWHDDQFAIRCYSSRLKEANVTLWKDGEKFKVSVYLVNLTEDQLKTALNKFSELKFSKEGSSWVIWVTPQGFDKREDVIKEIIRLAVIVVELLQSQACAPLA